MGNLLFICSVMSDSLWPHGQQHVRLPCHLLSPRVCSYLWPLSWWCRQSTIIIRDFSTSFFQQLIEWRYRKSASFIVFSFTFRSLIHFEFIFVYDIRECSNFILLYVAVQFSQHHLLTRWSFLHCIFLPLLS